MSLLSYILAILPYPQLLSIIHPSPPRMPMSNPGNNPCQKRTNQLLGWGVVDTRLSLTRTMATPRYTLDTTLPTGHSNSIVVLQFSPDGKFLASGSGDGILMVFSTSTWKPIKRFIDVSPLTAVIWHPTFPKTLLCGYRSGDVHTVNFESHLLVSTHVMATSICDAHRIPRSTIAIKSGPIKWVVPFIASPQM